MILQQVLLGLLLPAVACGAALAAAWTRREAPAGAGAWAAAAALALGYGVGQAGLLGWPSFPPVDATEWLPYFALASVIPGIALANPRVPGGIGWVLRVATAGAVPWLLFRSLLAHTWSGLEGAAWLAALGAALLALWVGLEPLARRPGGPGVPLAWLVTAAGGSVALFLTRSALLGQLGGVLAASIGTLTVASWLRPQRSLSGAVPVVAVLLASLWSVGLLYSEMPASCALLLAIAPLTAWITRLPRVRLLGGWRAALVCAAAAAVPVALALMIAVRSAPADEYYY